METTALERQETQVAHTATPNELLSLAVSKDLDIDKLAKLMDLQREYNAEQARKAFFSALSEFQATVPEIRKTQRVFYTTSSGKTEYYFAPLADISRQIKDACKKCGLAYRWEIQDTDKEIKVTCLVTHLDGHTERTTMTAAPDNSGGKNAIQGRASAIQYMKRYTLIGALGITTAEQDNDGQIPEIDLDYLHAQYIDLYNQLIQIDSQYTKWHPDSWKSERTKTVYLKAIKSIREKLAELTPKEA